MTKRFVFLTLALLLLFTACAEAGPSAVPVQPITGTPPGTDGYPWWNDTVFYEIFVRSFYDSDGDGVGDFNGIAAKLDYLNDGDPETTSDLGVTGIWLMPINPSPSYHGYDVTDYYAVNPDYGTMDDFQNLLDEAHKRGIRVIIDLVLNHTSSRHPWFTGAWDPTSPYHNWYVWSDTRPAYGGPWGQNVWYPSHGRYYYALFWDQMPDLNYANPEVTAEMNNIVSFWLEAGVDGFRLDAARHLIEEGAEQENTASTHAWYENFRPYYKSINPDAVTVGEVWDDLNAVSGYVQGDELDLAFQFGLAEAFVASANNGNARTALGELRLTNAILPPLNYAPFLTNHDMNRVMSELDGDVNKAKVAASMLLTAPGVPFLYYGEEVGLMGEKPDEDIRRPMQWSSEKYAGFSTSLPWRSLGPDWQTNNVAAGTDNPASLLSHYRALIRIRSEHAALRVGDTYALHSNDRSLYAILRASNQEIVLVIVNLSDEPVSGYYLSLDDSGIPSGTYRAFPILGAAEELPELAFADDGGFDSYMPLPEIPAFATLIIQLKIK